MTDLKFTSPSGETTLKLEGTGRLGTVTPKTQLHIHEVTDKREIDRMAKQLVDNAVKEVKEMTNNKQTPPDTIEIGGVKYKRVEDTQPFYDKLWGLLKTKLGDSVECDDMADKVRDLIREHIPEPVKNNFMSEYLLGYNECIREIKNRLFNGIQ